MNTPASQYLPTVFTGFFRNNDIDTGGRCLLAVSGGADSVVLCELSRLAGLNFAIAHCNFQLRGEESKRDEDFVRGLSGKYRVPVFVKTFDTEQKAKILGLSIQETARKLRYEWFEELRVQEGFSYILLAHHADDNIETLLFHFFRGTGLQGLTGMPAINGKILRPMLSMRRKEILDFATGLDWVEDSSNLSSKYTRNFLRNELLPSLSHLFPALPENLLANIERFRDIQAVYLDSIGQLKKKILEEKNGETRIPIRKLKNYPYRSLVFEIIRDYGFGEKQVDEVERLMESESGKFIQNENFQIIRHGLWLIIAPRTAETSTIAIEEGSAQVNFPGGSLEILIQPSATVSMDPSAHIAQLDARHIEFPLILRKWKAGDYFYPLGMHKKKKLARFFIDQKLSKNAKEAVWVIETNKKILWVVGMRIDDRFKITPATTRVLILTKKS